MTAPATIEAVAPDRIWAAPVHGWYAGNCSSEPLMDGSADVEYIRADLCITLTQARAMVGAALREAEDVIENISPLTDIPSGLLLPDTFENGIFAARGAILALSPDATAALDRALERMRERCHGLIVDFPYGADGPSHAQDRLEWAMTQIGNAIRALPLHEDQKP